MSTVATAFPHATVELWAVGTPTSTASGSNPCSAASRRRLVHGPRPWCSVASPGSGWPSPHQPPRRIGQREVEHCGHASADSDGTSPERREELVRAIPSAVSARSEAAAARCALHSCCRLNYGRVSLWDRGDVGPRELDDSWLH